MDTTRRALLHAAAAAPLVGIPLPAPEAPSQPWCAVCLRLLLCLWGLFAVENGTYVAKGMYATQAECDTAMRQLPPTNARCVDWQYFVALYLNINEKLPHQ
jgi:hypothetical protein